ncbi:MAG: adenylate/guanylate cyclase domain-containing protein [Desulfatirhabdiaceae bacterium]
MNGLLLIDDDEGVRRSVLRALKRETYPVFAVETGEFGIQYIHEHLQNISVVICDFRMPGLNGIETLIRIGQLNPEITRIVLTGYATMEAAIQATNEGIDGFLTKPFDNFELRAKIREIQTKKRLKQFVSEQVYHEITHSPDALQPRFHEATILFSDIRGFTRMTRDALPEVVADYLNNSYFYPMGEIIYTYHGTMDKHIGDSIMAVFGSPITFPDDSLRAVKAAVAMQQQAEKIDRDLMKQNGLRLEIGIGISSGKVFSGILGSLRKKEFTSIGMAVNIASRLQQMAGPKEILISKATFDSVNGAISAAPLPPVLIKGLDEHLSVYRVD